jgi:hypothetical protein
MDKKFFNKDGSLTIYALSCGYIEKQKDSIRYKTLFIEHSHIHVQSGLHGREREVWEVFEINELTKARKLYKSFKIY